MENVKLTALPEWVQGQKGADGMPIKVPGAANWFGAFPPPAIGQAVKIKINGIGPAIVTGYWIEAGYLGLMAQPIKPPGWYVKQNGGNVEGVSFGPEVEELDPKTAALIAAERFIAGFEGDELQEGIDELLAQVRAAI